MANPKAKENGVETRFKPGKSANPRGRKKGPELGAIVRAQAREIIEDDDGDKRERLEVLVRRLWKWALDGDHKAIQVLFDRGFGKVADKIEFEGDVQVHAIAIPTMIYSSLAGAKEDNPDLKCTLGGNGA